MSSRANNNPYFCEGQMFAWHCETSVLRPVLFHFPQIFLWKIKASEVSFFEVDDVLPFSKHKKTNLGSLVTHCISQPIAPGLQTNCARTSQKRAISKEHGLSANGGGKKKIRQDWIKRFVPFVLMSQLAEDC